MPFEKKKKKEAKNYKSVPLYFDLDSGIQKKCYDLLSKIHQKKSFFISLLVMDFMEKFKDPEDISEEDIKAYIASYGFLNKLKVGEYKTSNFVLNPEVIQQNIEPSVKKRRKVKPSPVELEMVQESAEVVSPQDEFDMDEIVSAMDSFTCS